MASMAARESRNWEESHETLTHSTYEPAITTTPTTTTTTTTTTTSASPSSNGSPSQYYHGFAPSRKLENNPIHTLTQLEPASQADYPSSQSRPSTSSSGLAAGTSSSIASSSHIRPFVPGLRQGHDSSLETPPTTSATSSPITPFTPYGPTATPITDTGTTPGVGGQDHNLGRQRYDSLLMLSPIQINEGILTGRHQPLEPPTESSMTSLFRGGSAHLQFFSTDSRGRSSPAPSHEPSP